MWSLVVNFVKVAFLNGEFPDSMNDTLILLIPKADSQKKSQIFGP